MRAGSVVKVVLSCALSVSVIGPSTRDVGAESQPAAHRTATQTLIGVLEQMVVDRTTGEDLRYALRTAEQTWWLDGIAEPMPPVGSTVEVTGSPSDEYTLRVASIRVSAARGAGSLLSGVSAVPRSTRVLVLRLYWTATPPAKPTTKTTRQKVLTDSRVWFGEVSHGRYAVSGTVSRWLKVPRPKDCLQGSFVVRDHALAAARRAGYRPSRFGRVVLYLPCSAGVVAGLGSMPGPYVWLYGTLWKQAIMHEQGHNLGLPHASTRECSNRAWGRVTWSSNCQVVEYGDATDAMGNRYPGHFNSYYKSRLGWLQRSTTVTSTRTVTLAPYETTGRGLKAVRVKAGRTTYWLEYRTRTGVDRGLPAGTAGVQIRIQTAAGKTQLLDAAPGSESTWLDYADVHLPAGSSWTTPQRVRFTVTKQTSTGATVAIRFAASAPTAPAAPGPVAVRALVERARITWTRPVDNGAIIRHYTITRSGDGATRTVTTTGGLTTSYTWGELDPAKTYTFSVKAVSVVGASRAAVAPPMRPLTLNPSVVINSPADGATVQGLLRVEITAKPGSPYLPGTPATPIRYATLSVDGNFVTDDTAPWGPLEFNTRVLTNGPHIFRVTVEDFDGHTVSATRTYVVNNPTPTVTITSPGEGGELHGQVEVTYQLSPADWGWRYVYLWIDGTYRGWVTPGEPFVVNATGLGTGPHTLQLQGLSEIGDYYSPEVPVTVVRP